MTRSVVIVTGAASGIGRAAAELYAERGYGVVGVDRYEAGLESLERPGEIATLVGDVAEEKTNLAAVELAISRFGRLDAAVLNAGGGGTGPLESDGSIERLDRVLAVNVRGVALGVRAVVPALRAVGGGSIVATSSISGLRGDSGGIWGYNAAKAAVINLVRSLALDYAAENIRINSIAPGSAITAMTAPLLADPVLAAAFNREVPLQRFSSAREQAEVIYFLTSSAASFVTGVTIPVDGGLSAATRLLPTPTYPGQDPLEIFTGRVFREADADDPDAASAR
ncbi:SDR family NAD(P)-dependent oxidoreductase [Pseudofrankia inefficax]|uniref:Short-chain dehydrogenase/reductase SDR n=1 Tax=Pseudofrankia inefficax (strain DSM 45817 / CECT 9037 / DDB 130130 / EuI1c) TaxID=298654 RepID=E3JCW9_PSEI1|nr:SDR family NAD(P)-dependent oxidoreductase [Pseudofrankia inefficax]ADP81108.1 short-chain dehydrogenase/reductase SDR [Pseudofrankia inefficax]